MNSCWDLLYCFALKILYIQTVVKLLMIWLLFSSGNRLWNCCGRSSVINELHYFILTDQLIIERPEYIACLQSVIHCVLHNQEWSIQSVKKWVTGFMCAKMKWMSTQNELLCFKSFTVGGTGLINIPVLWKDIWYISLTYIMKGLCIRATLYQSAWHNYFYFYLYIYKFEPSRSVNFWSTVSWCFHNLVKIIWCLTLQNTSLE